MAKNKYTDLDESVDNKWKDKYLLGLKEIEKKEIQWRDSEKNLRALITHLTDAADTSSLKLNKQLSVLRNALDDGVAANKLKKAIDEVADSILGLNAFREKKENEPRKQILTLIEKINPAGKIEPKLSKLSEKISKKSTSKEISPLINELAKLLVYGLSLTEKKETKGFFSSLLSKKESETESLSSKSEETQTNSETDINLNAAVKSLLSLLEKMTLPSDLQAKLDITKHKLRGKIDETVFIQSLEDTVAITANILRRIKNEKKEIEDFLNQLTNRLHELDSDIQETSWIRELTHQHGLEMTEVMRVEMNTMEEGLKKINNIEELKSSIQSRVIMLRDHVDKFLLNEDEKNKEATEVIEQLKQQVKVMESEAEELKEQLVTEREQMLRDGLTEIPNRLAYEERLELELANFKRRKEPFVLVVWDIDLFKNVNDKYGHAAGDQVLKLVATILNKNIREVDFVARYGGEEFVSILPSTDLSGAQKITDKVREVVASSNFHFRDEAVNVTLSSGFAEIQENENDTNLFARADKALYKAKENGRNICQAAE